MIAWDPVKRAVRALALFSLTLLCAGLAACKNGQNGSGPKTGAASVGAPTVTIQTATTPVAFKAEIARTPAEHSRGLMYRKQMDPDVGMLFVFDFERPQAFWMQNTFIPLDMIFIGSNRRIVGIVENAEPLTTTERRVAASSQYVFEIGGGLSARLGIRTGQQVEFKAIPGL
jgi:uncharacterized protein